MFSSRSVSETNPIHLSTVITWSNITIYCLHHCSIGGRIWIRDWICKMPTIPHPNFEENLPRYNDTALYIATALIGNVLLKLMTSSWFIGPVAALCLLICLVPKIDHSMEADSQWKCDYKITRLTLQVPRDFLRSRRPFGMTSSSPQRWYGIISFHWNFDETMCNFSVRTVPAGGLAPWGAM